MDGEQIQTAQGWRDDDAIYKQNVATRTAHNVTTWSYSCIPETNMFLSSFGLGHLGWEVAELCITQIPDAVSLSQPCSL